MSHTELHCRSEYVTMRDGTRLAVSTWLAKHNKSADKIPAVVTTTRYWRAMAFQHDNPEFQSYYPLAAYLSARGYVLVVADARGTGASFGSREFEASPAEIEDIPEVTEWAARQPWCDGRVATTGQSYTAVTTLYSSVNAPSALKIGVCRAPDLDWYRHIVVPGGIVNRSFIDSWGETTAAQDANDAEALRAQMLAGDWVTPVGGAENMLGVRPVDADPDGTLLAAAVTEHQDNFNFAITDDRLEFIDHTLPVIADKLYGALGTNTYFYKEKIEQGNLPFVIRCGWHDAGVQLGMLALFTSFSNPVRLIIGPWDHGCHFRVDPFQLGDGTQLEEITNEYGFEQIVQSLNATFKPDQPQLTENRVDDQFGEVEYYTLGENRWKTTQQWPLSNTQMQRFYLAEGYQLSPTAPAEKEAFDRYQVDSTTSTGSNNRWHQQLGHPTFFVDRREEDKKLLTYDSLPLERDVEITGHPVVHLFVRSSATDGQFFAYLETVDPDGRVRLLTEGQLRALHRKVSDETPPYTMFGPYHSLKEKDAEPLIPGEVAEIAFDLFPISVLLKQGQRIRLAIAGADSSVFESISGCESPEITVERNGIDTSYIDLPFV